MAAHEPIDPVVRLAIAQWPDDAPRGAVSTSCAEHGISRKSFYELHKRAVVDGPAAVLEPRTRRPRSSPTRLSEEVKEQALGVRAALEASGLDHGPRQATEKAEAPRPTREQITRPITQRPRPAPVPTDLPPDTVVKTLTRAGVFMLNKVFYNVGSRHGFQQVLVTADGDNVGDKITVTDLEGTILIEHTRPAPGITYVGNGRPRGPHAKTAETSPMS